MPNASRADADDAVTDDAPEAVTDDAPEAVTTPAADALAIDDALDPDAPDPDDPDSDAPDPDAPDPDAPDLPPTQHVDALFAVARLVCGPTDAADLVAAAYRRAAADPVGAQAAPSARVHLLRHLREGYAEQTGAPSLAHALAPDAPNTGVLAGDALAGDAPEADAPEADDASGDEDAPVLDAYRRAAATHALDRTLDAAFLTCPPDVQLTLLLAEGRRLTGEALAAALGAASPQAARTAVDAARATLRRRLLAATCTSAEAALLRRHLPPGAPAVLLRARLAEHVAAPPAALRDAVARIVRAQQAPDAPLDAPAPSDDAPEGPAAKAEAPDANASEASASEASGSEASGSEASGSEASGSEASGSEASGSEASGSRRPRRIVVGVMALTLAGLAVYALAHLLAPTPEPDVGLLERAVQQAALTTPTLRTPAATAVEGFVAERTGRRLALPRIDGATLTGAGLAVLGLGVEVPVVFYADAGGAATGRAPPPDAQGGDAARLVVYALSYATLDRLAPRYDLGRRLRRTLEDEGAFATRTALDHGLVLWRTDATIYLAVTPGPPDALRARIRP